MTISNSWQHQFSSVEILLQCESTSALLNIRNQDSKTILSELALIQKEFGKNESEDLKEHHLHYFNIRARYYVIRSSINKFHLNTTCLLESFLLPMCLSSKFILIHNPNIFHKTKENTAGDPTGFKQGVPYAQPWHWKTCLVPPPLGLKSNPPPAPSTTTTQLLLTPCSHTPATKALTPSHVEMA